MDPPAYLNAILKQRPLPPKLAAAIGDVRTDIPPWEVTLRAPNPITGWSLSGTWLVSWTVKLGVTRASDSWVSPSRLGRYYCTASSVCVQNILLILISGISLELIFQRSLQVCSHHAPSSGVELLLPRSLTGRVWGLHHRACNQPQWNSGLLCPRDGLQGWQGIMPYPVSRPMSLSIWVYFCPLWDQPRPPISEVHVCHWL